MQFYLRAGTMVVFAMVLSSACSPPSNETPTQQQTSTPSPTATSSTNPAVSWKCSEAGPWSTTFVGDAIVWTDYSKGTVVKAPIAGGAATTIATNQSGPCAIATDGSNLYWTNNTDGTVMKMRVAGASPTAIASNQREPSAIAVRPTTLTWMTADGGRIATIETGAVVETAKDDSNAGGGTNPGTIKCHVCPVYCQRYVPQIPMGYWESYICGWQSCPPCGA